jgi:hypothetical protein
MKMQMFTTLVKVNRDTGYEAYDGSSD